ncbi:uncharacterized protein B0H18DRAFT_1122796 [Fomitopsis serialis]|uniref:uncharacterized protein n=1 Tax=Fomitopsis serialis TaxID=139415 RepID=UPI0020076102|nr:uncharacterized protein B0H18DRAFT_1122796 [Neoantrodia serialis]KAH9918990.1 hypothetical protein B0H18DRAFT_1122796 [Neoantrodia serialis]
MSSPSPSVSTLSDNVVVVRSGRLPDKRILVFYVAEYRLGRVATVGGGSIMRPGHLVFIPLPGGRYAFFCCGPREVRGRPIGSWNVQIVVQESTLTVYWYDEVADKVHSVTMYDDESFRTLVCHCFGGSGDGAISQGVVSSQSTRSSWRHACGVIVLYLVALYISFKATPTFVSVTKYM